MKIIKLTDTHYIGVDGDSEIKEGDWYLTFMGSKVIGEPRRCEDSSYNFDNCKKITHSTEPLEDVGLNTSMGNQLGFAYIEPLSLSEVEEAIYGYSVEKMAKEDYQKYNLSPHHGEGTKQDYYDCFERGFNTHKEKDKFILSENDLHKILDMARLQGEESFLVKHTNEDIIQSLLPTEWECTIDEQGKITLL